MKKLISIFMAVIMIIEIVPTASVSAVLYSGEGWSFDSDSGTLTISTDEGGTDWYDFWSDFHNYNPNVNVKSLIISSGVTVIGIYVVSGFDWLTSVIIPNSVIQIGHYAFSGCTSLSEITIPDSVIAIGWEAFYGCKNLISMTFKSATPPNFGESVFVGCEKLTTIFVPKGSKALYEAVPQLSKYNIVEVDSGCPNCSKNVPCAIRPCTYPMGNTSCVRYECQTPCFQLCVNMTCTKPWSCQAPCECNTIPSPTYIDEFLNNGTSTTYDVMIAELSMKLSSLAYNENDIKNFLIKDNEFKIVKSDYVGEYNSFPAYTIAEKIVNGKKYVVVAMRGTDSNGDWITDAMVGYEKVKHQGFEDAKNYIYSQLYNHLDGFNNTTFLITGHSYGGAIANLLAKELSDNAVPQNCVFAYTFATPNVAKTNSGLNPNGIHDNIFNICNQLDPVTGTPVTINPWSSSTWIKYGRTYWFSVENADAKKSFSFKNHSNELYLAFMKKLYTPDINGYMGGVFTGTKKYINKTIGVFCPVDVDIFDNSGTLIAQFIDNKPHYSSSEYKEEILLFAIGDEKYIVTDDESKYTVKLTATDNGTMDYIVQSSDLLSDDVSTTKTFENVQLTKDKEMISEFGGNIDVPNVRLFVTDGENPTHEILTDGSERIISPTSIIGTWKGYFSAPQGDTGLTVRINTNGTATVDFYNLQGQDNSSGGTFIAIVNYDNDTGEYFIIADEWIKQPDMYSMFSLCGTVNGSTFAGTCGADTSTTGFTFTLTKTIDVSIDIGTIKITESVDV